MKKKRALFFLYLSLAFILGHILTPHQHVGAKTFTFIAQHQHEQCSIYKILKETLTQDIGHKHLEDYNTDASDISFSKIVSYDALVLPLFLFTLEEIQEENIPYTHEISTLKIPNSSVFQKPLRAPPYC